MILIVAVIAFISVRFGGSRLFLGTMVPLGATMLLMFIFSENIVNIMLQANDPDPKNEKHALFVELLTKISKKTGLWVKPRGYIVTFKNLPNAVAYGTGLPFFRAVAVTEELIDLMTPDELEAVIAHEIGHIRSKDVGIMIFVGVLMQILAQATNLFLGRTSVFGGGPFAFLFGYLFKFLSRFVFSIMRFAISQEREFAADALAADAQGTTDHMISALRKLKTSRTKQGELFNDTPDTQSKKSD
jgi:heat shock protein HtpX